jgi:hypothetical protein
MEAIEWQLSAYSRQNLDLNTSVTPKGVMDVGRG